MGEPRRLFCYIAISTCIDDVSKVECWRIGYLTSTRPRRCSTKRRTPMGQMESTKTCWTTSIRQALSSSMLGGIASKVVPDQYNEQTQSSRHCRHCLDRCGCGPAEHTSRRNKVAVPYSDDAERGPVVRNIDHRICNRRADCGTHRLQCEARSIGLSRPKYLIDRMPVMSGGVAVDRYVHKENDRW